MTVNEEFDAFFVQLNGELVTPEGPRAASLRIELAELYDRARRAIDEARTLTADHKIILCWCGMWSSSKKPPVDMLED